MAIILGRNCPAVPEHGALLPPKDGKLKYYCPHQEHDGRAKSHPKGLAPQTRAHFTKIEVETGEVAATPMVAPAD